MHKIIKRLIFLIIVIGLIVLADIIFMSVKNRPYKKLSLAPSQLVQTDQKKQPILLFYSNECPHCTTVKNFIKENRLDQKITIEQKELHNHKNINLLIKITKKCHLKTDTLSVPFIWDGSHCLTGDKDIIDYFNQKMHAK